MRADVVGKYIKRYKPIGEMYSSYCTLSQAFFLSSVEPGLIVLLFSLKRREGYGPIQPIVFSCMIHGTTRVLGSCANYIPRPLKTFQSCISAYMVV